MVASIRQSNLAAWVVTLTRTVVGSIFAIDGAGRLLQIGPWHFSIDAVGLYLWTYGVPYSMAFSWGVSLVEAVGGVLLLGGLLTRYAAAVLAFAFTVAAVLIHGHGGYAWGSMSPVYATGELTAILIVASVVIALGEPGRLPFDGVATRRGRRSIRSDETEPRPGDLIPGNH